MINGILIQDIGERKILEPFAVTLESNEIILVILGKDASAFCTLFLGAFLKSICFRHTLIASRKKH